MDRAVRLDDPLAFRGLASLSVDDFGEQTLLRQPRKHHFVSKALGIWGCRIRGKLMDRVDDRPVVERPHASILFGFPGKNPVSPPA
jgi:hypothetical protein